MAYPPAAEIAEGSAELEALTPEQLDALYAASINAVETYCGQSFGDVYDGTHEIESARSNALYLPQRIIVLRSVIPFGGDPMDLSAIGFTHDGARLIWKKGVVGVGYYEQALQEVSDYAYADQFPDGTVIVDGEWGWENPPGAVLLSLRLDMVGVVQGEANALTATVGYMRQMGIERISQGNLDLTLTAVPTISPVVSALLDPFVFLGTPPGRLV